MPAGAGRVRRKRSAQALGNAYERPLSGVGMGGFRPSEWLAGWLPPLQRRSKNLAAQLPQDRGFHSSSFLDNAQLGRS